MVDFDKLNNFLDELFVDDDKAQEILKEANITSSQIKIINILIVNALRAYHTETNKN